ncbi:MAG: putative toxin-antitoxin system toxin component, PIN family [Pyrinomonadaceae bacterium]
MPLLKAVLDTNVVISAHIHSTGHNRFIFDLGLANKFQLYVSGEILAEYEDVLRRPRFAITPIYVNESLKLIKRAAKRVRPKRQVTLSPDKDDNKFLECAEASGADYLVTGNKRHFPLVYGNTKIVNARELVEIITPELRKSPGIKLS